MLNIWPLIFDDKVADKFSASTLLKARRDIEVIFYSTDKSYLNVPLLNGQGSHQWEKLLIGLLIYRR